MDTPVDNLASDDDGFDTRYYQIEAWARAHGLLKFKWWLLGMPERERLKQWLDSDDSPFNAAEEARIREIVHEEAEPLEKPCVDEQPLRVSK